MTDLRTAAQQALEAMENVITAHGYEGGTPIRARDALKAALAEPMQDHEDWCASVTQLLLSYPPQKAPCNCRKKQAEPYAGKAARINNDRIQVDPVTGDVSIGTPQTTEPVQELSDPSKVICPACCHQFRAIPEDIQAQLAKQEPVAWRTFDGEGGYDYRDYELNEDYRNCYIARNGEKYSGWVEPLYTNPHQ